MFSFRKYLIKKSKLKKTNIPYVAYVNLVQTPKYLYVSVKVTFRVVIAIHNHFMMPSKRQIQINLANTYGLVSTQKLSLISRSKQIVFDEHVCLEKWLGKSMREVFREEFRRCSDELLERRREEGQLTCNLQPIRSLDTKLTHNDLLTSTYVNHAFISSSLRCFNVNLFWDVGSIRRTAIGFKIAS